MSFQVRAKALATHGRALLVGDVSGDLHLWDAAGDMSELWVVEGAHADAVQALALAPEAAFSVPYDQLVKVWALTWTRGGSAIEAGQLNEVRYQQLQYVARRPVQNKAPIISLTPVSSVTLVQTLEQCSSPRVCGLDSSDDLLVSGEASALRIWRKRQPQQNAPGGGGDHDDVAWRFDCFLNAGNGRNLKDFLILRSDGRLVAACDFGGSVYVWNTDSKQIKVRTIVLYC